MEIFSEKQNLDIVDKRILELLQEDANYTNKEIAAQLGLTITPVYERIKKLKRNGIIKKTVTIIDAKKAGKNILAFCNVSLKEHTLDYINEFQDKIVQLEEVQACYHIAGQYDYLLTVYANDMDEYQNFITTKLAAIENIAHVQSSFVMKEIKKEYSIKID
ncbi:MAG TPA: Lrp/AsnC family transcriptional regulator [Bacteroidetes bacterium]|nr:Lrp/AsnC family transcriptional regulator [Bacteroidota bacterium]